MLPNQRGIPLAIVVLRNHFLSSTCKTRSLWKYIYSVGGLTHARTLVNPSCSPTHEPPVLQSVRPVRPRALPLTCEVMSSVEILLKLVECFVPDETEPRIFFVDLFSNLVCENGLSSVVALEGL